MSLLRRSGHWVVLFCLPLLWVTGVACAQASGSVESEIASSRVAYDEGRYSEAIANLEGMVGAGNTSGELFYNLGNAHYRAGHLGQAILAYRRAQLFMPRDADLQANLSYVRSSVVDQLEAPEDDISAKDLVFWYEALSVQEQTWLAILFGALAWAGLFLRRLREQSHMPLPIPILMILSFALAGTAVTRHVQDTNRPGAVVVHAEITARSGTDAKSVALFYLHEGAEVRAQLGNVEGWIQITLPDGRRGWVESQFLGLVLPRP